MCALTVVLPELQEQKPKFLKPLEDQTIPVGEQLELKIKTSGNPRVVRWYKNDNQIAVSATEFIRAEKIDDNNYKLIIPKAVLENSGNYTVIIENNAGQAESDALINVEPVPEFLTPLQDLEVIEGELAEFNCTTNCRPKLVKWYKNEQEEVKNNNRIEICAENIKFKLIIKWSLKDDTGAYKIVLENLAGKAESLAKLTVTKAVKDLPKIIKQLIDQIVAEEDALIFEIKVQGNVNEVKWLKDGQSVEKSIIGALIEKIDDQTFRLTIPKTAVTDAGEFEAIASNAAGKATSSAVAKVDQRPIIVKGLEPAEISVGDDQLFRVEVSAPVREIKWYKNRQEIKPSTHFKLKPVTSKKYELEINKAELDDGATYKVKIFYFGIPFILVILLKKNKILLHFFYS